MYADDSLASSIIWRARGGKKRRREKKLCAIFIHSYSFECSLIFIFISLISFQIRRLGAKESKGGIIQQLTPRLSRNPLC
mmetsp:Transcript_8419/g.18207  ORF Transcript_8419/g.18207 Transcript_8419/m.18207 type:complete len:80 (+) Transcript_8419:329-568(+)